MTPGHPLAALLADAAEGRFPSADGGWRRVPPWRAGLEAVVAFTGHAVLAVADDVPDDRLRELGVDGLGGAHDPRVVAALAGPDGWIDVLDALLVTRAEVVGARWSSATTCARTRGSPSRPPSAGS